MPTVLTMSTVQTMSTVKTMSTLGLHNLFHPTIRDGSTWSKFGAHGEHGDVFPVLQLRCARILRKLNQIFIAYFFKGSQEQSFFLRTLLFTAFLATVLKILTYALWLVDCPTQYMVYFPGVLQICWQIIDCLNMLSRLNYWLTVGKELSLSIIISHGISSQKRSTQYHQEWMVCVSPKPKDLQSCVYKERGPKNMEFFKGICH